MKRIYKLLPFALLAVSLFASCLTPAEVNYLQDMRHGTQIERENAFQARVCPYDELDIYIFSSDEEQAKPFNLSSFATASNQTYRRGAYLVDVNGNIQFPILGTLHVSGLTRLELQDTISRLLISNSLLTDAVVVVRFSNFKIFFLGAEGGKAITISNERCTFLEALALAGGLNAYTSRNKIAVMREVDGKMVMRYLDPRSSSVFQDPFFMLQQNDFIITQNYTKETPRREARNFASWLSIGLSTLTFFVTIAGYLKPNN
jgi:polysaccharide export outer membrane protein